MTLAVWANNASSTLASGISDVDTTLTVQAGQGTLFPTPSAGQYAMITLETVAGAMEITKCTGRTGDTLTIVRAQESTSAIAFASGSRVECRVTAGILANFLQHTGDTLADATISGIVTLGGGGSIRNGEWVGGYMRGAAGDTSNQLFVPPAGAAPTIGGSPILTKANFLSQLPTGAGVNVTGMIMYWNGTTGTIPTGYILCDGTAGTPDLRDKFVVGAGSTYIVATTGGSTSTTTGSTSGAPATTSAYTLVIADMPAHHHKLFQRGGIIAFTSGGPSYLTGWGQGVVGYNTNDQGGSQMVEDTGGGGGHSHAIGSSAHTHTYTLPPYRALVAIMKS